VTGTFHQNAAGVFMFVNDNAHSWGVDILSTDFASSALKSLELAMLAQAQECFYLKAVMGTEAAHQRRQSPNRPPMLIADGRCAVVFGPQTALRRTTRSPSWPPRWATSLTRLLTRAARTRRPTHKMR